MTVRKADAMTSEAVPAIHAGVNATVASYTQDETLSAAQTVALAVLPGGARITDCKYVADTLYGGSAVISVAVQGNTLVSSATEAVYVTGDDAGFGVRLTSDATATISITNVSGDTNGLGDFRVIFSYLADKDPD